MPRFTPLLPPSRLPAACPAGPPPPHCPNSPPHPLGRGSVGGIGETGGIFAYRYLGNPCTRQMELRSTRCRLPRWGGGHAAPASGQADCEMRLSAHPSCFPHALHPQSSSSPCSSYARVLDDDCSSGRSPSFVQPLHSSSEPAQADEAALRSPLAGEPQRRRRNYASTRAANNTATRSEPWQTRADTPRAC